MKDGKACIVVAQTDSQILRQIMGARAELGMVNQVLYTTNPGTVLKWVEAEPVDIVVTGQHFYLTDLTSTLTH